MLTACRSLCDYLKLAVEIRKKKREADFNCGLKCFLLFLICIKYSFHSVCPLRDKDKRLMEAFCCERLTAGETGSCSDGWGHVQ